MRIKRLRQIDCFFLLVIISFTFDFGNIKYALAGIFVAIYFVCSKNYTLGLIMDVAGRGYKLILEGIGVLLSITIFLQLINGFNSYAINEAVYFLTPLMLVWVYVSKSNEECIGLIMNYSFVFFILAFFYTFIGEMTFQNIMNISFLESYSPFESERAFIFLIFECYFLTQKKRGKALMALGLCILSFKRICMIVAILIFIFSWWYMEKKEVSKTVVSLTTMTFIVLPIITCVMLNSSFTTWFYSQFGVSLHTVTLSRSSRIEMAMNSDEIKYGLGSVTTYMTNVLNMLHGSNIANRNLHNDLVRIYLECGVAGSIAFTYVFMKAFSFSKPMFVLICYIFFECYFNHLFGAGTADMWIITYLFMAYVGRNMEPKYLEEDGRRENGENNGFYPNV